MNSIVTELKQMEAEAGKSGRWKLEELCKMAALEIEVKATRIAELTAAHEMQGESLVVLPRWMVSNMADKTEAINAALEDVKYYVGNPSAWEHYDDGVSEKIRAILKAAGMA